MKRFVADGVHQTSVADIAADVGVTERTFYRHFPSKHAVIFADYDIGFEWFARALALRPHGEPITASVRKAVDAFPFDFQMVREAATIRSRDLDQDIITSTFGGCGISSPTRSSASSMNAPAHRRRGHDRRHRGAQPGHRGVRRAGSVDEQRRTTDIDELSRLTDIALSALEDGLTHTLRHAGLD